MKIVLVGPPGSGKSTQSLKIRNDFNFQRVSTGDVFREYFREHNDFQGVYTKQNLDNGVLCSDEIMNRFVADEVLTPVGERLILDGYPRTCAQARAFDLLMRKRGERYVIIHFSLKNDDMILERILLRGEKREDDSENIIRERLQTYRKEAMTLIPTLIKNNQFFLEIDAWQSPENIYNQIKPYLQALLEE